MTGIIYFYKIDIDYYKFSYTNIKYNNLWLDKYLIYFHYNYTILFKTISKIMFSVLCIINQQTVVKILIIKTLGK